MQPHQQSRSVGCSSCWVVPPPTPAPASSSSEPPTPARQSTDNDKPSTTAPPMPPPLFRLLKRRLPFLVSSAAGALLGGASSGGGLLPLLQQPYPSPLAVTAAHAATPPTPLPLPLLVAGVTANSPAKPAVLLLPIGKIEAQIDEVGGLLKDPDQWPQAFERLSNPPFTKADFKKTFNAYSDTIYRATDLNGYTSNPPSSQQSIQYLYRNEILTNLEELREELQYLMRECAKGSEGDWSDRSGLEDYWGRAKVAMGKYLSLAPPDDVQAVREAVANQRKQPPR